MNQQTITLPHFGKNELRVLKVLAKSPTNCGLPVGILSDHLGLSEKCVRTKIKSLHKQGYIRAEREYPGIPYTFRVLDSAHEALALYL